MCRSPCPMVWAHATAACSTTRRNSSERSDSMVCRGACLAATVSVRMGSAFVGRQFTPKRLVLPEAENVIRLHQGMYLARAFVDHRAFAVAIEPSDRVLVGISVGTVHLHGIAGRR